MKFYQLTYLISPDLDESQISELQKEITSFIQEKGGILGEIKSPQKITLGYPIKKKGVANWITINFHFNLLDLPELEKKLKKNPKILRYLIFVQKVPKKIPILPKEKIKVKVPSIRREKVDLKEIEEKLKEILGE